ncbi:MAG: ABC transporter ATP-binding protein [Bacteroidales bacterium]
MKPIIEIEGLTKVFKLGSTHGSYLTLRDSIKQWFKPTNHNNEKQYIKALDNISFEVQQGEKIGIIGKNGAGKSTLLKILSRITPPSSGRAVLRGRVASLLEVGTGFHGELTGRENIFLNGAILGMKRNEIKKKLDEIVAFSGVERFLDTPLKHYSSGMQVRLAFAVAANLDSEILLVDEVLAVGDAEFQKKSLGKMDEISNSGRTIFFVSHNLNAIANLCSKSILIENGKINTFTDTYQIINKYLIESITNNNLNFEINNDLKDRYIAYFKKIEIDHSPIFSNEEPIIINLEIIINKQNQDLMLAIILLDKYKNRVFSKVKKIEQNKSVKIKFIIPQNVIAPNYYSFQFQLYRSTGGAIHDLYDIFPIQIIDAGTEMISYNDYGNILLNEAIWEME